ncbi:MAG: hypothetical protein HC855_07535 [Rhizobiales bacterium]|nr:hypothetical protein [Hyphomicrobiales bacterium]
MHVIGTHHSLGAANGQTRHRTETEAADHIAQTLIELRRIAKTCGLPTLTGLLEIAYYEAYSKVHPTEIPEDAKKWVAEIEKVAAQL